MRRVVDTVILALVTYSLGWPIVRGFVVDGSAPRTRIVVEVRAPGVDLVPHADVRIAASVEDARAGRWLTHGAQRAGAPGVSCSFESAAESVWLDVDVPGASLGLREVRIGELRAPVEVALPADARVVTGTVPPTNRRIRIALRAHGDERRLDVPCDARGRFVLTLPGDAPCPESIAILTERGHTLAELALPVFDRVHDVGSLDG